MRESPMRTARRSTVGGRIAALLLLGAVVVGSAKLLVGQESGSVAVIYYWKAKPGKLDDYNRYIRDWAAHVDAEAQRQGAFLSVTTYVSRKSDAPWTHMRIFILKDRAQAANLSEALDKAGTRYEPEEGKRKEKENLAAKLRDFVAEEEVDVLK